MGKGGVRAVGSDVSTSLMLVGIIITLLLLLGFLQQSLKRRAKKFHAPIDVESESVLDQINRRKEDLNRYINKLKSQLETRQKQLAYHDKLEEVVTSRVQTSRRDDSEWSLLMETGREVHGDKWDETPTDGSLSLREMMELHKDELLEYKQAADSHKSKEISRKMKQSRIMALPITHHTSRDLEPTKFTQTGPPILPQWQSSRALASPRKEDVCSPRAETDKGSWSRNRFNLPQDLTQRNITPTAAGGGVALSVVPRLDFTKLAAGIGASNVYPLKYQSKDSSTNPFIGRNNKQQNTDEDDHEDSDKSIKAKKKASQRQQRLKNFLMRK